MPLVHLSIYYLILNFLHQSPFLHHCPLHLMSILLFLSVSSCQSLDYLSISPFLRLFSLFPALRNHGHDPCGEICPDKMSLTCKHTRKHSSPQAHFYTHKYTRARIQKACICPNKTSSRQQNEL